MKKCSHEWCDRTEKNWNGRFLKYNNKIYCEKHQKQLKNNKVIYNDITIVHEHGINDMPYGWTKENEWNYKVYIKWYNMIQRVYSEKYHEKEMTYINSTLQLEMHWLSYFVKHFKEIEGYDEEKFLKGELELDKDIKSNGTNKEYSIENCMLVSKSENSKQANKTRVYKKGKDSPLYGIQKSEEHKRKLSESKKEKYKHEKHNRAKQIYQYDLKGNIIKKWECIKQISDELNISYYMLKETINGKRNTYEYKGFIWKYEKDVINNDN